MNADTISILASEAREITIKACLACGAGPALASSLAAATLSAARFGQRDLGFPHLLDYLEALKAGRINGYPRPIIRPILPSFVQADADGGIAQLPFDLAYDDFRKRVSTFGVAVYTQKNSYTAGELGYYVRRLALDGLVAIAVANGPALMTTAGSGKRVYCTNPIAFGAPTGPGGAPVVIDQASSATAFVRVKRAADLGQNIPEGWAVDQSGRPTTDALEAIEGALLPFGGYKGANIALIVELLAAGLSGASWSMDGADFLSGDRSPDTGMTIIAIAPATADNNFSSRIAHQVRRLTESGVHVPTQDVMRGDGDCQVEVSEQLLRSLREIAAM